MHVVSLEEIIRRYVVLGKLSPKGFHQVKCAKCNDYKERGGFKFEGEVVVYKCFNCSTATKYDPSTTRHAISPKFKEVLVAFGIPEAEIDRSVGFNFFKPSQEVAITQLDQKKTFPTQEVPLPINAVSVTSGSSPWCEVAEAYLTSRMIKSSDYPFFVSEGKYEGRLLIPYYFRDKIVYWQGRSMDDSVAPRYKNPTVEKDNIFFNMDELYRYTDDPLFVVEGPLDAISIGKQAIALLGSTLTEFKREELRKTGKRRQIVFVIDKNKNGKLLALDAINEGWSITCFPDNVEDANDALQKYGKLWLTSWVSSSAKSGFSGKLQAEMSCK